MMETRPKPTDTAARVSARAFLLSLLREWDGWSLESDDASGAGCHGSATQDAARLLLPLPFHGVTLAIAVSHASAVGCHGIRPPFYEVRPTGEECTIPFALAAALIATEPAITGDADAAQLQTFLARVLDSMANVEDVVRQLPDRAPVCAARDISFIEGEQTLRYGHAVHPTPRSRDEFSITDSRQFAAEYGAGFQLRWWAAAPGNVVHASSRSASAPAMVRDLLATDGAISGAVSEAERTGRVILPMHPWQAARLALDEEVGCLMRSGAITDLGPSGARHVLP
ncbi:hypothetical protein GCM10019059_39000 [Camelimonas fluminis]|uniref:IucA/IucC family protein n=1 Tax=Camelimonas fluminis TaxID=1576911 RepID=A0ABV7UKU9_9HYPH|nr:IucA/IucC family siderophore biosynthesis protein [Camelimonas fluminis]GHE75785.1 hypothetical protein GCM10019059_39000 [Camelimonas fluminis]